VAFVHLHFHRILWQFPLPLLLLKAPVGILSPLR
jgi:hypothetical protein